MEKIENLGRTCVMLPEWFVNGVCEGDNDLCRERMKYCASGKLGIAPRGFKERAIKIELLDVDHWLANYCQ